jgi:hypothetical protein
MNKVKTQIRMITICCILLTIPVFQTQNSPQSLSNSQILPEIFHTKIYHVFSDNSSVYFSIYGGVVSKWNTSVSVYIEFRYSINLQTSWDNDAFSIIFIVEFFDSSGNFQIQLNKSIFNYQNVGNQLIDGWSDTFWNLTSALTGISRNQEWTGKAYMIAEVTVGDYSESNNTSKLDITYKHISESYPIPSNVIFGFITLVLIVLFSLLKMRGKEY